MPRRVLLVALCLVTIVGLGAVGIGRALDNACPPLGGRCDRVLFLGNSYTFVNDLPGVFRELARASGRTVVTGLVAEGGETLAGHAASSASTSALDQGWTYVVFQEQSEIPSVASVRSQAMFPAARSLVAVARAHASLPIFLATWAHRDGWPQQGLDYAAMQAGIDAGYAQIGSELGVPVARAGDAWSIARTTIPGVELWQSDGSHPTLAGTYLAASVLYLTIFHADPRGLPNTTSLSDDVAARVRLVAAATPPTPG